MPYGVGVVADTPWAAFAAREALTHSLGTIYASGWTVVAASTVLTVAAWFSSLVVMG
jgi:hypothetical protein